MKGNFTLRLASLAGCGKTRAAGKSLPQALKRGYILEDLTARLNVVPFPNPFESELRSRLDYEARTIVTGRARAHCVTVAW